MDADPPRPPSPIFYTRYHRPYFSPVEVEALSMKQRGKLSTSQEEKQRQQACVLIEAVGGRIGFPRKTIATAQNLYHRFHLMFPRKDFNFSDVALACLYASSKMHDTLKKPQDILMVSYAVRFPDLAAKSQAVGGELVMDPEKVEQDRHRLLGIERPILETICFNFTTRMPFPYVVKIGRALGATKYLTNLAWRLATDSNRTLAPLQYPPHSLALSCVYLAALLLSYDSAGPPEETSHTGRTSAEVAEFLGNNGPWQAQFKCSLEDVQEIAHVVMDLLLHESTTTSSAQPSPSTPQSPSPYAHLHYHPPVSPQGHLTPSIPHLPDQLTRLKILMRENDVARERNRNTEIALESMRFGSKHGAGVTTWAGEAEGLSLNSGVARFMFGPYVSEQGG
ncbi:cyclin-like protein [Hysterangium stoloniferum]|nr:cyclin-like protein [Hysterangium stoloniferum]